jgi:histone H3/H4
MTEEEKTAEIQEEKKEEENTAEPAQEEELTEEEQAKLPFPEAAVVRIMKRHLDKEKMIKKEVKIAMNKWLGSLCEKVSKEMNKYPYVTMHLNEFNQSKRVYESLEEFTKEKERILSHFNAIKKDIDKLERDLGKAEEELIA